MMLAEASVSAYQDVFVLSGIISLFNILPALLRSRRERQTKTAEAESLGIDTSAVKSR
jgi:hypothetical protein